MYVSITFSFLLHLRKPGKDACLSGKMLKNSIIGTLYNTQWWRHAQSVFSKKPLRLRVGSKHGHPG